PHEPFHCLQRYWDLYEGADIPIPRYPEDMDERYTSFDRALNTWHGCDQVDLRNADSLRALHRAYLASVSYVDEKVGEILAALDGLGLADDTIVMVTSDHGDMLGWRGMVQKRCFYEQSARIPLLIAFPDCMGYSPGRVGEPVSLLDIFPTVLQCAGIEDWLPVDGRSLLPHCRGDVPSDRAVIVENHSEGTTTPCFMVRRGRYKYTLIHGAERQLFDIEDDPAEWENLSGRPAYAEVEQELRGAILNRFDPDRIDRELNESLARRAVVKQAMVAAGGPRWDYQPYFDESKRYWREG
ncbi:MAG: sulfatase-like hydrolase/transferase, partial [Chitinivibrionales bacterium]|nr:sulfatase-like hydrolase/transferase [Chitinivibrionales bacterium]